MRQILVRLAGECKARGRSVEPALQYAGGNETAKGVVRLHAVQPGRVILEELFRRQFFRIEIRLPLGIREAGSTCKKLRHRGRLDLPGGSRQGWRRGRCGGPEERIV